MSGVMQQDVLLHFIPKWGQNMKKLFRYPALELFSCLPPLEKKLQNALKKVYTKNWPIVRCNKIICLCVQWMHSLQCTVPCNVSCPQRWAPWGPTSLDGVQSDKKVNQIFRLFLYSIYNITSRGGPPFYSMYDLMIFWGGQVATLYLSTVTWWCWRQSNHVL